MKSNYRWISTLSVVVVVIAAVGFLGVFTFGWSGASSMGSGMMGGTYGMGSWGTNTANVEPLSNEQAEAAAERYLGAGFGSDPLELAELMVFDNHFYAQARETETGRYAFEFLVDRFSGQISAEPGPNMMWNEKYGHMGGGFRGFFSQNGDEMPVSGYEAIAAAQKYLDRYVPGLQVDDHAATFHGYYTLHTLRDGEVVGMLSVNGYSGAVWLHNWHGVYLGEALDEAH